MNNSILTDLYLKNYKAFKYVHIPIKPITIFLGANSIGKSSITQLFLLLKQTAKEDKRSYSSALKLYGDYVNFGSPTNLFHGFETQVPINISFSVKSPYLRELFKSQLDNLEECISEATSHIHLYDDKMRYRRPDKKQKNGIDFDADLDKLSRILKSQEWRGYKEYVTYIIQGRANINPLDLTKNENSSIKHVHNFLYEICEHLSDDVFHYDFRLEYKDEKLYVSEVCIRTNSKRIISISCLSDEGLKVKSDFADITRKYIEELSNFYIRYNTIFRCFQYNTDISSSHSTFVRYIGIIVEKFLLELKKIFSEDRINYVSPLRAHPKRYYMLDKVCVDSSLDTLDGDALTEILRDKETLRGRVNLWLSKFGFSVDVEVFKEVIHHLKVQQNGLTLDISDVGFGISQILPVIIQSFLSNSDSILIMEQPEIHLHPKMQADLCDLLISVVNKGRVQKQLIIETHSEYLLKRLRRRMAEQEEISSEDVSICMFYRDKDLNGFTTVKILNIENKGYFEWPEEFYDGEIYNDTIEFLRLQRE